MPIPLARGHKEVRRSTAHIMVTARYSNKQGSKSRQNPYQAQPTENIGNISEPRLCLEYELQFQVLYLECCQYLVFQNLNYYYKLQRRLMMMCCPTNKVIKSDTTRRVCTKKTSYATFYKQWHRPMSKRFIKPPYSISRATSIDSDCCRLPTASVLSNKAAKTLRSDLINKLKFLKTTNHQEKGNLNYGGR